MNKITIWNCPRRDAWPITHSHELSGYESYGKMKFSIPCTTHLCATEAYTTTSEFLIRSYSRHEKDFPHHDWIAISSITLLAIPSDVSVAGHTNMNFFWKKQFPQFRFLQFPFHFTCIRTNVMWNVWVLSFRDRHNWYISYVMLY